MGMWCMMSVMEETLNCCSITKLKLYFNYFFYFLNLSVLFFVTPFFFSGPYVMLRSANCILLQQSSHISLILPLALVFILNFTRT